MDPSAVNPTPPALRVEAMDSDDDIPLNPGPKLMYPYPLPVFATPPATGRWLGLIERLLTITQPITQTFISQVEIKALVAAAIERLSAEPNYLTLAVDCDESNSSQRSRSSSSTLTQSLPPSTRPLSNFDLMTPPEQPPGRASLSASAVSAAVNSSPPINVLEDLVLVGDIHGQYVDLLTSILSVQGRARLQNTPDKTFLFLGDYVDRGPQSVETLLLLLALKVEYPTQVYLLRGNHEETQTCKTYGFMAECRQKLQLAAWYLFTSVFCELPVAAIIRTPRGSVFACHGGLSPNMMSDPEEVMCFTIRQSYGQGLSGGDDVVDGLLWSDPGQKNGFENNPRGCGFRFGPDASESFCKTNGFDFIVRAHQMVQHGYQWEHTHRVLTIFSAPNYCGINDNLGAICILHCNSQWLDKGLNQPLATDILTKMPIRVSPLAPQVGRRARSIESLLEFFGFGAAVDNIPVVDPGVRSPVGSAVPLLEDGDLAPPRPAAPTAPAPPPPQPPPPNTDVDAAMMDYFAESSMDQLPDF